MTDVSRSNVPGIFQKPLCFKPVGEQLVPTLEQFLGLASPILPRIEAAIATDATRGEWREVIFSSAVKAVFQLLESRGWR